MKRRMTRPLALFSLVFAAVAFGPAAGPGPRPLLAAPESFEIDPVHSEIGFKVRHFVTKVPGRFNRFEGAILYDADKTSASSAQVTIEAASIDTKNERRDGHLKSPDFFDVEKFPMLTFVSKSISFGEGNAFTLTGDLTMHGVTKPVTLTGEVTGIMPVAEGEKKIGFSATGKVNRKDYGILWNKTLDQGNTVLGDDVEISLEIEATSTAGKAEGEGQEGGKKAAGKETGKDGGKEAGKETGSKAEKEAGK